MDALTSVGSFLFIEDNAALTNVDALATLQNIGESPVDGVGLAVRDNPLLARCAIGLGPILTADQSAPDTILGTIEIFGNAPGGDCTSEQSILNAYIELPAENVPSLTAAPLAVYPNPAAARATFTFALEGAAEATLVLYDALGREVARLVDGAAQGREQVTFDASALPAGLYVARLVAGDRVETVRLNVVR